MSRHRGDSVAESSSASNIQAQNVYIQGGTFNSAGNQNNYYVEGSADDKPATYEQVKLALKDVPNYRDVHGANLSKATKGTGPKFDEWKEYCEWLTPGGKVKAMWGTGMPGAGKTVFAAIALNAIEAHAKASKEPICVAYIYFRYSDHTKATTHDFLEVLVKQTLERHPQCRPIACNVYARHIQENTSPSEEELLGLLDQFSGLLAIFYFLDAMDEAPPDVQLDLLEKLNSLNVGLFITSRPMDALQARFPAVHRYRIRAQDLDLDLHIRKEISRSPILQNILNGSGPNLLQEIMTTVKAKCDGMFLHASLQLDALRDCASVYDVEQVLSNFPSKIEDVYQQTWKRIQDQSAAQALVGRNVLLWVLCAERSLKIDELRHLVATCPETHKVDLRRIVDEETLIGLCRGLVAVEESWEYGDEYEDNKDDDVDEDDEDEGDEEDEDEGREDKCRDDEGGEDKVNSFPLSERKETRIVRFVHYTAKGVVKELISKTSPHPHSIPTHVCLELLVKHGFQWSTIASNKALGRAMEQDPPLRYAYEAWSFHAKQSLGNDATIARLSDFIQACSSFPLHVHHPNSSKSRWDRFQPLHIVSYFNLPLSLAGSASLRNPDLPSSQGGFTPLMLAVLQKSIALVQGLLAQPHIDVNAANSYGETALFLASWPDREDIFRLLFNHPGVNPNQATNHGITPLILASQHQQCSSIVRLLLAHSEIDVNQVSERGATALMDAEFNGCHENVELLLSHPGIKVDVEGLWEKEP